MKLKASHEIAMPPDRAFAAVADFEGFERASPYPGTVLTRVGAGPVAPGAQWDLTFPHRGGAMTARCRLVSITP